MEHTTTKEEPHRVELTRDDMEDAIRAYVKAPKDADVSINRHHLEAVVKWKVELP